MFSSGAAFSKVFAFLTVAVASRGNPRFDENNSMLRAKHKHKSFDSACIAGSVDL